MSAKPKRMSRVLNVFIAEVDLMFKNARLNIIIIVLTICLLVINGDQLRKVVFPIHFKLIGFTLALLAASLGFYVAYAVDLFKSDKIAYVFEAVSSQNSQSAQSLSFKFQNAFSVTDILGQSSSSPRLARGVFEKNPFLAGFLEFKDGKVERSVFAGSQETNLARFAGLLKGPLKSSPTGMARVKNGEREFIAFWSANAATLWSLGYISSSFPDSALYQYHLILDGKQVYGPQDAVVVAALLGKDKIQQVFAVGEEAEKKIVAMEPLLKGRALAAASADYDKAIAASLDLRNKSLYFGLFVAGIAIFLVLLFSRFFTRPIEALYQASQKFADRDFGHRVRLSAGDELGVLGDSFNRMAGEISHYMEEMKEKNRLENELKTAQLVQESFFPTDALSSENFVLKAYYRPAAECGGDWWGCLEAGGRQALIVADVTGHGTAAALVTAVIHNSLTALKYIAQREPEFLQSPAKIMTFLNDSLLSVESSLFATAFVLCFDEYGRAKYCNASHNPPYRVPGKAGLSKNDFEPLMEKSGPRLGESSESLYAEVAFVGRPGDKIFLYTDGLLELENGDGKAFGNRRFVKKLIEFAMEDPEHVVSETVKEAFEFAGKNEPGDDITLLCLELRR